MTADSVALGLWEELEPLLSRIRNSELPEFLDQQAELHSRDVSPSREANEEAQVLLTAPSVAAVWRHSDSSHSLEEAWLC